MIGISKNRTLKQWNKMPLLKKKLGRRCKNIFKVLASLQIIYSFAMRAMATLDDHFH
jgi:hypothetical protein